MRVHIQSLIIPYITTIYSVTKYLVTCKGEPKLFGYYITLIILPTGFLLAYYEYNFKGQFRLGEYEFMKFITYNINFKFYFDFYAILTFEIESFIYFRIVK